MKIALVRRSCSLRQGGAERYCAQLAEQLVDLGHDVTVVGHDIDEQLRDRVDFLQVGMIETTSRTKNLSFAHNVADVVRQRDFDVVYGLSRAFGLDVYRVTDRLHAHWLNMCYRNPLHRRLQRLNPRHRAIISLERTLCQSPAVHRIITESHLDRHLVRQYYQTPEKKVRVVRDGIDTEQFNPNSRRESERIRSALGLTPDEPLILFASMDFARKGLRTLLKSLARMRTRAHLLVLGTDTIYPYAQLARRLGIADRVIFAGRRNAIERYYGAADIFCLPTIYEPFGLVHLEAMACGTPVITTGTSGAAEIVEGGRNGYVISHARAAEELSNRLDHYFSLTQPQRCEMSRCAAETAEKMTLAQNARDTVAVLEEVCEIKHQYERRFDFEQWDNGRLVVNVDYAQTLRENHLTTFEELEALPTSQVVRSMPSRETSRLALAGPDGEQMFYIKKHKAGPIKEYIKPLLRLTWPVLGASNEWNAMIEFHRIGIPTMVPVAFGRSGRRSFVLTRAIEQCENLEEWLEKVQMNRESTNGSVEVVRAELARILRTMHDAGMHHQDFYLCHLLRPKDNFSNEIYVLDLGRVRRHDRLSRRWIVKDLAQLNYSAREVSTLRRLRFLRQYLGRPLQDGDRRLVRALESKARSIERHTAKHDL